MERIKAVIFDMDGVLIDAKEWHYEALNRALTLFGFSISRYDHLVTYDGLPTRRKLEMLTMEQNRLGTCTDAAVRADLEQARLFQADGRRLEADAVVRHAEGLLAQSWGQAALGQRVREARTNLDLDAALGALPPKQRQAVAYHYLAGLPYSEIAAILDSSVAAARRAAADGIATLRRTYPLIEDRKSVV